VQFSLDRFYRINRRALIWLALFGLIYILRDFFALIFLTFLFVSFTLPAINYFTRETRIPRTFVIVVLYALILAGFVGVVSYTVPKVVVEATNVAFDLNTLQSRLENVLSDIATKYPSVQPLVQYVYSKEFKLDERLLNLRRQAQPFLLDAFNIAITIISTLLLSLLFAFLIVLDLTRLREEVRRLGRSRLHDFYEQSAGPVVRFAGVLAESFRAQAMIALTNTVLTTIGFLAMGLPRVTLLAIIVFMFSFIPVLGVFISTAPAVLVALNAQGFMGGVKVIAFVVIIHAIEAYILNPLIYGRHMKLNPVLVIIILYVGHHFFGLWGMLLGVPVAYYFIYYVFQVPTDSSTVAAVAPAVRRRFGRKRGVTVSGPLPEAESGGTPDSPASPTL